MDPCGIHSNHTVIVFIGKLLLVNKLPYRGRGAANKPSLGAESWVAHGVANSTILVFGGEFHHATGGTQHNLVRFIFASCCKPAMGLPFYIVPSAGPMTPRMIARLLWVRKCVIATHVCAIARFLCNDPYGALNDFSGALFGTSLLGEDAQLQISQGWYRFLRKTIGSLDDGSFVFLLPYMMMSVMNIFLSSVRLCTLVSKFGTLLPNGPHGGDRYLPLLLSASVIIQFTSVGFCSIVLKQLRSLASSGGVYMRPG